MQPLDTKIKLIAGGLMVAAGVWACAPKSEANKIAGPSSPWLVPGGGADASGRWARPSCWKFAENANVAKALGSSPVARVNKPSPYETWYVTAQGTVVVGVENKSGYATSSFSANAGADVKGEILPYAAGRFWNIRNGEIARTADGVPAGGATITFNSAPFPTDGSKALAWTPEKLLLAEGSTLHIIRPDGNRFAERTIPLPAAIPNVDALIAGGFSWNDEGFWVTSSSTIFMSTKSSSGNYVWDEISISYAGIKGNVQGLALFVSPSGESNNGGMVSVKTTDGVFSSNPPTDGQSCGGGNNPAPGPDDGFSAVKPLLAKSCLGCHSYMSSSDTAASHKDSMIARVTGKSMPMSGSQQANDFTDADMQKLLAALNAWKPGSAPSPGGTATPTPAPGNESPGFMAVKKIFADRCLGCHTYMDKESEVISRKGGISAMVTSKEMPISGSQAAKDMTDAERKSITDWLATVK